MVTRQWWFIKKESKYKNNILMILIIFFSSYRLKENLKHDCFFFCIFLNIIGWHFFEILFSANFKKFERSSLKPTSNYWYTEFWYLLGNRYQVQEIIQENEFSGLPTLNWDWKTVPLLLAYSRQNFWLSAPTPLTSIPPFCRVFKSRL